MNTHILEELAEKIGVNWARVKYTPQSLLQGYKIELEHGKGDKQTNVTNSDPMKTMKIALAHLKETPKYYEKLKQVEK